MGWACHGRRVDHRAAEDTMSWDPAAAFGSVQLAEAAGTLARSGKDCACGSRRWRHSRPAGGVICSRRRIGSEASSCCGKAPRSGPRRSRLPAGPGHRPPPAGQILGAAGGAEPESALAAAGQTRRRARCWRRSTAGSPRASTPLISKRPRPSWRRWGEGRTAMFPPVPSRGLPRRQRAQGVLRRARRKPTGLGRPICQEALGLR